MLDFGRTAWADAGWGGEAGPLRAVAGGLDSLSIRVVEHWEYGVGGGLVDERHHDVDSVVTLVALLADPERQFDGGVFRTFEPGGVHLEHAMGLGDVIAFVSHKYHNVTPVTRGARRSLVIELWQGGESHAGR